MPSDVDSDVDSDVPSDVDGDVDVGEERPGESREQQLARNMAELLQELRVAQAGVQILFAFLLSVAFATRFGQATSLQRVTLVVTILLTTLSAVFLMAPAVWHRR